MGWGVYAWLGVGLALMAAEAFFPGAFLLWLGIAAVVMGVIVAVLPDLSLLTQVVIFAALSVVSILIYRRFFPPHAEPSDQPLLDKKVAQMVGRTFVLEQPIVNGHGKVRVNDALWSITGEDLPAGARVTVVASEGITLRVQAAP
jgi:membrane protein implicated in regulation of membrane protease activity